MSAADVICSIIFAALVVLGVRSYLEDQRARRADAFEDPSVAEAPTTAELADDGPPGLAADHDAAAAGPLGDEPLTRAPSTRAGPKHRHTHRTALLPSRNARRRSWH